MVRAGSCNNVGTRGTIEREITALLGQDNVCSPTLNYLIQNFVIWPLIDKSLVTMTNARPSS